MKKLKVGIGSDHEGLLLKHVIVTELENAGVNVVDLGVSDKKPSDYSDVATKIAEAMLFNNVDRGVLIGGTGVGMSITANKYMGIRAAICHDVYSAREGVQENEMNVLCLGQKIIGVKIALEIVHQFLNATYSTFDIHRRRVAKVLEIEAENMKEVL